MRSLITSVATWAWDNMFSDRPRRMIPGFYFDAEKQRYFRLPPRHFSHLPQYDELQEARERGRREVAAPEPKHPPVERTPGGRARDSRYLTCRKPQSMFKFIQSRQYETEWPEVAYKRFYESYTHSLRRTATYEFDMVLSGAEDIDYYDMKVFSELSGDSMALVGFWEGHQELHLYRFPDAKERKKKKIALILPYHEVAGIDLCSEGDKCSIIYRSSLFRHYCRYIHFKNIPGQGLHDITMHPLDSISGQPAISCVTLNHNSHTRPGHHGAIGTESGTVYIIERLPDHGTVPLYRRLPWRGPGSSVLSLAFSKQTPVLYCGHRNGKIDVWDLRGPPNHPATSVVEPRHSGKVQASVIGIHPLNDENYIISNALQSQLGMWDLRIGRKAVVFGEHINPYRMCQSIVDPKESFVAAVGSDKQIRIWSLDNAALLRTITSDEYLPSHLDAQGRAETGLPVMAFTERFLDSQGPPSLLVVSVNTVTQFACSL